MAHITRKAYTMDLRIGRLTLRVFRSWYVAYFVRRRAWQLDLGFVEIEWKRR